MKLEEIEKDLKHGDIIIIRRNRWLSKAIAKWTGSAWAHTGIVVRYGDEWFIIDSNEIGVRIDFLQYRLASTEAVAILRPEVPKGRITNAIRIVEEYAKNETPYDFKLFFRTALKTAIGLNLNLNGKGFTCTEFCAYYLTLLNFNHGLSATPIAEDFFNICNLKRIL